MNSRQNKVYHSKQTAECTANFNFTNRTHAIFSFADACYKLFIYLSFMHMTVYIDVISLEIYKCIQ
jgi:hypothetical protein